MEEFLSVGIITTAHGVHGELKVYPTTDDPKRFKKLKNVIVEHRKETLTKKVESVKFFKQFVIIKLEGIDTMDDALLYKNDTLLVSRKDAVKLNKDEYFIADLFGLKVYDDEDKYIGVITDVFETGANDVYEIETDEGRKLLVPAIRQCILNVDVNKGTMVIHVLEGLFDL